MHWIFIRLQLNEFKKTASRKGLTNIETIQSDCATGLEDESIDIVLLYDVFHQLKEANAVLEELHRILKRDGILSFSDHHMKVEKILAEVTQGGLFQLLKKNKKTYNFIKISH